jgi:hypothetical protein
MVIVYECLSLHGCQILVCYLCVAVVESSEDGSNRKTFLFTSGIIQQIRPKSPINRNVLEEDPTSNFWL